MIKLTFAIGGNIRKVVINNRKISMLTAETGFVPIIIDLDKMDDTAMEKLNKMSIVIFDEISKLKTEESMSADIIKDFQQTGWRCVHRE